tara:strand:+ start:12655 stop:13911 length:1257 start_codon:yes stop_codon:yes gene_type:complete
MKTKLLSGLTLLTVFSISAQAEKWAQWRGPNQDGISPDKGLMAEWPEGGPEKIWTYDNAGMGYSSFSFGEDKLFTLGTRGDSVFAIALNPNTGEEVWASEISNDDQKGYSAGWGHGPRSTPTYDAGKIYAFGPKGTLACLNAADGSKVWSKNLQSEFSGKAGGWGYSESPVIDGDKVVIAPGGDKTPLVALDKSSGETIWTSSFSGAGKSEYATVVVSEINGVKQYVKLYQQLLVGVNAESGELIWKSEWPRGRTAVIPTPIVSGNEVYITSGYGAGSKKVKIEGSTATDVWDNKEMKNHHGGVIKLGDYLYGFSDGGGLVCQSWETGEIVWNEKGRYTQKGAVHLVDGKLICVNEADGMVTMAKATPEGYVELGQFKLEPQSPNRSPKGKVWSHPVVLDGRLYLRDQEFLTAFKVKG